MRSLLYQWSARVRLRPAGIVIPPGGMDHNQIKYTDTQNDMKRSDISADLRQQIAWIRLRLIRNPSNIAIQEGNLSELRMLTPDVLKMKRFTFSCQRGEIDGKQFKVPDY